MIRDHWFNVEEVELVALHRRSKRLFIGLLGCLVLLVISVLLVIALAPKIPEVTRVWGVTVVACVGIAYCFVVWPKVKDRELEKAKSQRAVYLWLKRREWREKTGSLGTPGWGVVDEWRGNHHFYAVTTFDRQPVEWEDPLKRPTARRVKS